ncbi:MAG: class I SAM-dependent methyltransferase [Candidatus Poseidoniales archaeon]|nr:MAG: class I SAM-dependent methyltransferase [Candidatus Poseidoniales archaeon]
MQSNAQHWDAAYNDADTTQLGWYQKEHAVSMDLISSCDGKKLIDVGAGATTLVDTLLSHYYEVTVLDVSSEALRILSKRHGNNMKYIQGDLTKKLQLGKFDIWHDRAVLHFLLKDEERKSYVENLESCIGSGGFAVIETFSTDGAQMCCGLDLHTYDEDMLTDLLGDKWTLIDAIRHTHINPFGGERPYISTIFKRQ